MGDATWTRIETAAQNEQMSIERFARQSDAEILRCPNVGRKCLKRLHEEYPRDQYPEIPYDQRIYDPTTDLYVVKEPTAGNLDIWLEGGDAPIKLHTRGGSDCWVDLTPDQALDVARELVRLLDGDCTSPIAALAQISHGRIEMRAAVGARGGSPPRPRPFEPT